MHVFELKDKRPSSNCSEQGSFSACDGNEEEESRGSHQGNVFGDSSEDEDWEKECIQYVTGKNQLIFFSLLELFISLFCPLPSLSYAY